MKYDINSYYATGKRKTCCARVFLKKGTGVFIVNGVKIENYFTNLIACIIIKQPLSLVNMLNQFDFNITVYGGGLMGQASAIRHGITKALIKYDEKFLQDNDVLSLENNNVVFFQNYRKIFRKEGFVTRDSRKVERKKVGFRKARKRQQYSKR
ncbi:MAG: 30S ribosomal protein S9 [Candidatus Azosocius agrarius]|nr:MAG: 30S ribosomal protein S9 [Gammaproteobacteria bacterium]